MDLKELFGNLEVNDIIWMRDLVANADSAGGEDPETGDDTVGRAYAFCQRLVKALTPK